MLNLASANKIKATTVGEITMDPDDTAIGKIKAKAAMGNYQGQVPRGCKSLNCESIIWLREGN